MRSSAAGWAELCHSGDIYVGCASVQYPVVHPGVAKSSRVLRRLSLTHVTALTRSIIRRSREPLRDFYLWPQRKKK